MGSGAAVGTCTTNRTGAGPVPTAEPTQYTPGTRTQPRLRQPCRTARLSLTSSASSINSIALQTQTRHQNQETDCTGQRRRISEQRSGWRGLPGSSGPLTPQSLLPSTGTFHLHNKRISGLGHPVNDNSFPGSLWQVPWFIRGRTRAAAFWEGFQETDKSQTWCDMLKCYTAG